MHLGKTPVNGGAKNSATPTAGTELAEDTAYGRLPEGEQEDMIVDKLSNRAHHLTVETEADSTRKIRESGDEKG